MNTSMSMISYTDALPELVPGGWGRTRPWTHPHLPPTGRPAPAPPSRLQQLLRSLQTVDRYQKSPVSPVFTLNSSSILSEDIFLGLLVFLSLTASSQTCTPCLTLL